MNDPKYNEGEISDRLLRIPRRPFAEVLNISQEEKVDMRTAAWMLGIGRVTEATKLRGIYP
jgi:glutamate dehydrogenase (NAD(P)+)